MIQITSVFLYLFFLVWSLSLLCICFWFLVLLRSSLWKISFSDAFYDLFMSQFLIWSLLYIFLNRKLFNKLHLILIDAYLLNLPNFICRGRITEGGGVATTEFSFLFFFLICFSFFFFFCLFYDSYISFIFLANDDFKYFYLIFYNFYRHKHDKINITWETHFYFKNIEQ